MYACIYLSISNLFWFCLKWQINHLSGQAFDQLINYRSPLRWNSNLLVTLFAFVDDPNAVSQHAAGALAEGSSWYLRVQWDRPLHKHSRLDRLNKSSKMPYPTASQDTTTSPTPADQQQHSPEQRRPQTLLIVVLCIIMAIIEVCCPGVFHRPWHEKCVL